jgi:Ca2+:H+ antiporter
MKLLLKLTAYLYKNPLASLLIFLPLAIFAEITHWGELWVFAFSAVGVIPLAGYIGEATEALAHFTGPRLGGLLNATLGNAAELIITIVAIRKGLLELVKASITGSILGNLLLVLGMSMLFGGLRNGIQRFDRRQAGHNAILLVMTVLALLIPSLFSHSIHPGEFGLETDPKVEALSLGVAGVMIVLYALGLIYSLKVTEGPVTVEEQGTLTVQPRWSLRLALIVLAAATIGVAYLSELLVSSVEPVVQRLGVSEFFIGIVFIPIIGNVAEHLVALQVALKNQMSLSVEIAVASSLQIALFVAPVLVFISLLFGHNLTLTFNQVELLALIAGVMIATLVSADGESNWLEGAELLAIYIILGLAFFLL